MSIHEETPIVPTELKAVASEELENEVDAELHIPDPPESTQANLEDLGKKK